MPVAVVARRSVAFLLIKSSVNFVAVAIIGVLLWLGVGPDLSPALTILGTAISVGILVGVPVVARALGKAGARGGKKLRAVATAVYDGVGEAGRLLKQGDPLLIGGAIGYWFFDNLVLLATFHAFGLSPPLIIVLMAYLCGQLGGILPLPGGIGGIDGGLIGTLDRLRHPGRRGDGRGPGLPRRAVLGPAPDGHPRLVLPAPGARRHRARGPQGRRDLNPRRARTKAGAPVERGAAQASGRVRRRSTTPPASEPAPSSATRPVSMPV